MWEILYIFCVYIIQASFVSRLGFLVYPPDLTLISVIVIACLYDYQKSLLYSAGLGLLQDIGLNLFYFQTITKALLSSCVTFIKDNYDADPLQLSFICVAVFTPALLLLQAKNIGFWTLFFRIFLETFYNLLLVAPVYYLFKRITNDKTA